MNKKVQLLITICFTAFLIQCDRENLFTVFENQLVYEPELLMVENWNLLNQGGSSPLNLEITFTQDVINANFASNYSITYNGAIITISDGNITKNAGIENQVTINIPITPSSGSHLEVSTVTDEIDPIQTLAGQILTNSSKTFTLQ
jgi:hypothetical protein